MTEYDTLFAARRLLATVEAGRAASLSLAAAYLPLRSAAALREQFQDQGAESSLWPEAAVERRLAIERLRRAPLRALRGEAPVADGVSALIADSFQRVQPVVRPAPAPLAAEPAPTEPAPLAAEPAPTEPAPLAAEPAPTEPAPLAAEPAPTEPAPLAAEPAPTEPAPLAAEPAAAPTLDEFDLAPADDVGAPPLAAAIPPVGPGPVRSRRLVPENMLAGLKRPSVPPAAQSAAQASEPPAPVESPPAFVAPHIAPLSRPDTEPAVKPEAHQPSGLAARLGALARNPTASPPVSGPDPGSRPATQVTDQRRDERIARRIALAQPDRKEATTDPAMQPEPAPPVDGAAAQAPAPVVEPPLAAPGVAAPTAELAAPAEVATEAEGLLLADTDSEPTTAPSAASPADSLRSLAASLGAVTRSAAPATPAGAPALAMTAAPALAPRVSASQPPAPAPATDLEGPYITLETPVVRESAGRSTTAAIEVRAAARIGSAPDETIALDGKDGPHEDIPDDDDAEGMRVHFEVASPSRGAPAQPEPGAGRLSFDDEDLTVVQRVDESPTDSRPAPVDQAVRRLTDDAALNQFLEAARQYRDRGEYPRAIQAFTDALDIRLSCADAYIGRGRCQMELGDYTSAVSDFRRAEDLQPKHPDPQVAMGDLYFARKEYKRAVEFYDQAVELDGAHAMARCRRGISHYYRKNFRQAFQDLQRANALDPEIPNIKKYVQMALKKMERGE